MVGSRTARTRKINGSITKKVIELHHIGYVFDFLLSGKHEVICLQDNKHFLRENVTFKRMGEGYDLFSHSNKYIFTIETTCGKRGIFLADRVDGWVS